MTFIFYSRNFVSNSLEPSGLQVLLDSPNSRRSIQCLETSLQLLVQTQEQVVSVCHSSFIYQSLTYFIPGAFGGNPGTSSVFSAPKPASGFGAFSGGAGAFGGGTTSAFGQPTAGTSTNTSVFGQPTTTTTTTNPFGGGTGLFGGGNKSAFGTPGGEPCFLCTNGFSSFLRRDWSCTTSCYHWNSQSAL